MSTPLPTMLDHDRYQTGAELGRGGQGVVLRVHDREAPERELVAKVWLSSALREELLAGEFALLSRLRIPGLVRAHDLAKSRTGALFLVEDYVDGPDASAWIGAAGGDRDRAIRFAQLLADVAVTLALLHEAGFVHGDLKPAHVRVPASGRAMVLDLGASVVRARAATDASAQALTRQYAAPELLAGAPPSVASDLYALGALGWALATGEPPSARRRPPGWLLPSLRDLLERLLSEHPADRFADARELLAALGRSVVETQVDLRRMQVGSVAAGAPRERELDALSSVGDGVTYLTGAAGMGKSHMLAELCTRTLLSGKQARLLRFPNVDAELSVRLIAWLRGSAGAPFVHAPAQRLLLLLDDLESAPPELALAIEAFRCRPGAASGVQLIAALRCAPAEATQVQLGPLDARGVTSLCRELGQAERAEEVLSASEGNPAFVVAALCEVPLTRQAVLSRAETLAPAAKQLLAAHAVLGGRLGPEAARALAGEQTEAALAQLCACRLIVRRDAAAGGTQLSFPALSSDLADALAGFDEVDALADALLQTGGSVGDLLAAAGSGRPPGRRAELLLRAAEQARREGRRAEEADALIALAADPRQRTSELLTALDRVTRGGGSAGLYPQLVNWLEEASHAEPALGVLASRRRAEQLARAADYVGAEAAADRALALAEAARDPVAIALVWATRGSLALYRSDWPTAETALERALSTLSAAGLDDTEELARLHANRGIVALYRARFEDAFKAFGKAVEAKRALGDRGGVWAALLNLGLAAAALGRHAEAEQALEEALSLCRALGQKSGVGWALAALADVAVKRGDAREAERRIAEAEHLGDELVDAVRADLRLLRADVALLEGNAAQATREVARLSAELRRTDALVDCRALVAEARAALCALPLDRRTAARRAIAAIRRARAAGLPEPETRAASVLSQARAKTPAPKPESRYDEPVDFPFWELIAELSAGKPRGDAAREMAGRLGELSASERVFVVELSAEGAITSAFGVDLDGLPIADAEDRVETDAIGAALAAGGFSHQPRVTSRAGLGSRVVAIAPGQRAALVLEHRFVPECYAELAQSTVERWAALAGAMLRMGTTTDLRQPQPEPAPPELSQSLEPSTVLPLRARRRSFPSIVGVSAALERALVRLDAAADSDLPVLITGETGSGKELFARALHDASQRQRGPFVALNCGGVPDTLFEAELFGHARGSFTGADRARPGLIAQAERGTLLLDEIGELPLSRQAVLLRVLATRRYRPVGSDEEKPFDVRIVAATNRDLEREVEAGRFRRDLLYRLNVLAVRVPPLRERREDIGELARHVLRREGTHAELAPDAIAALEAHDWPGNVRELEHQLQRVAALGVRRIELGHLSRDVRAVAKKVGLKPKTARKAPASGAPRDEKAELLSALKASGGNITHAAKDLGMTRQGLKKKMVRLGLREPVARGGRQ